MSDLVLQVEQVSKMFRRGSIGTGSLRQDINRWWKMSILKKEDPFFITHNQTDITAAFWALKDINLDVREGEVWGIVGPNGAGKSTLLKILSRIVKPTSGIIRGNGRISSLLEVGTGFHQELSGRENIFLSGYILGMSKQDILRDFDEIVSFSGVEKFIDTPVKRYSSGMYVRLAFAVAAFLQPDILIVDEVLAVGDGEFQKKCLGKMKEVSSQKGRTILFVSHNMQAIKQLCNKGLLLKEGKEVAKGDIKYVVNQYLKSVQRKDLVQLWHEPAHAPGNEFVKIHKVELVPHLLNPDDPLDIRVPFTFRIQFWNYIGRTEFSIGLHLYSMSGEIIFDVPSPSVICDKAMVEFECEIPGNFLNDGSYYFSVVIVRDTSVHLFLLEEFVYFELEDYRENIDWYGKWEGVVRPKLPFKIRESDIL